MILDVPYGAVLPPSQMVFSFDTSLSKYNSFIILIEWMTFVKGSVTLLTVLFVPTSLISSSVTKTVLGTEKEIIVRGELFVTLVSTGVIYIL